MPNISVIIINWSTPELVKSQMEVLHKDPSVEVILVDNFSTSENAKKISQLSKKVSHVILNNKNLGFSAAGNQGAHIAKGEWLLFLNPDLQITDAAVSAFVKEAIASGLDAASPTTDDPRYLKPLPSLFSLITEFSPLHRVVPLSLFTQKTLTGGCLLIKKDVFEKIGKWDEDYFLWFEDSDITKRLLDAHYKVGWVDIPVVHQGGASFTHISKQKRNQLFFTSMKIYANKHFSHWGNRVVELLAKRFT
ncbi:glycosyltransferase family 2 protein [Candidatus Microgenomates bacterium]|nr:glycosyltransferase family 2 protein [Candidatus Microgenomates bacterium]